MITVEQICDVATALRDAEEAAELIVDSWRVRAPKKLIAEFDLDDFNALRQP